MTIAHALVTSWLGYCNMPYHEAVFQNGPEATANSGLRGVSTGSSTLLLYYQSCTGSEFHSVTRKQYNPITV